jgi:hypothetical protein
VSKPVVQQADVDLAVESILKLGVTRDLEHDPIITDFFLSLFFPKLSPESRLWYATNLKFTVDMLLSRPPIAGLTLIDFSKLKNPSVIALLTTFQETLDAPKLMRLYHYLTSLTEEEITQLRAVQQPTCASLIELCMGITYSSPVFPVADELISQIRKTRNGTWFLQNTLSKQWALSSSSLKKLKIPVHSYGTETVRIYPPNRHNSDWCPGPGDVVPEPEYKEIVTDVYTLDSSAIASCEETLRNISALSQRLTKLY